AAAGGGVAGGAGSVAVAVCFWGGLGGGAVGYRYWNTNITAPMRRNASSSRTSIDISLGGNCLLPPLTGSAMNHSVEVGPSGPDRNRPRKTDGNAPAGAAPSTSP